MTSAELSRPTELHAVADFLAAAQSGPAGLVVEGEAGIGKTTLWFDALERARRLGFRVLSAHVDEAETVLAFAAVGDLFGDLEPSVFDHLPALQRLAVDRALLRAEADTHVTDQRVAAAAFASVVDTLALDGPVLIAVDDVQWLDPSSRTVLSFGARRFRGAVGILVTERADPGRDTTRSWLRLGQDGEAAKVRLGPLSLGALNTAVTTKLGRALPRPVMTRILEISGGNPFYALELARNVTGGPMPAEPPLPETLTELVRARLGRLDDDVRSVLLAIACAAAPTIDLVARVDQTSAQTVVRLLESVETDGTVAIVGNRVRFAHPLLARGIYTDATPAKRRAMHRALGELEAEPELRARHLALATATKDDATLAALDAAADSARTRGAPAAAAELLDLAIGLGGDKPWRRVRAAGDHFQAGSTDHAENLLTSLVDELRPGMLRAIALNLLAAVRIYDNNFVTAIDLLTRAVEDARDVPPVLVQTLLNLSFSQGHGAFGVGSDPTARFEGVMHNAREAVAVAEKTGIPAVESQALSHWVMAQFMHGYGIDEHSLQRALATESHDTDVPIPFSASACDALIATCTGRLDEARDKMTAVRRRCQDRGADRNMLNALSYSALVEMWSGNLTEAAAFSGDAVERAQQLGSGAVDVIALSIRAAVFAHAGRADDALADADVALAAAYACDAPRMAEWPLMAKGFLELSQGRSADALATLEPLIARFDLVPGTEILLSWYLPNAVEAMISLDRLDDALPLIETLERDGAALDRPWLLAAGARCRAMWLAATGDVTAATEMAQRALAEHARTPMRFERARTVLLLGKLHRRRRQKDAAQRALAEALSEFEQIGAPLWANQVRAEQARTNVRNSDATQLTSTESRVAELAAQGMKNKDIAAVLFVQPKTVEHYLSRVYDKLGVRSRVELVRRLNELPGRETTSGR